MGRVVVGDGLHLRGVKVSARAGVLRRDAFGSTVIARVGVKREAGCSRARISDLPVAVSLVAGFALVRGAPSWELHDLLEGRPVDPGHGRHRADADFVVLDVVEGWVALAAVGLA